MIYTAGDVIGLVMLLAIGILSLIVGMAFILTGWHEARNKKENEMAVWVWSDRLGRKIRFGFVLDGDAYEWCDKFGAYVNESNCYERFTPEQANALIKENKAHWI